VQPIVYSGRPLRFVVCDLFPDMVAAAQRYIAEEGMDDRIAATIAGPLIIDTHGYGNAGHGPLGQFRDENNQEFGPGLFSQLDSLAERYAAANFAGCL
jgi:hypothetical protein